MDLTQHKLSAAIDRDLTAAGCYPRAAARSSSAVAVERQIALDRAHDRWLAEDWRPQPKRRGGRR